MYLLCNSVRYKDIKVYFIILKLFYRFNVEEMGFDHLRVTMIAVMLSQPMP